MTKAPAPPGLAWRPIAEAKQNITWAAVYVTFTCACAKGGRTVLAGSRIAGEWHLPDCEHTIEITDFCELPLPPGWGLRSH